MTEVNISVEDKYTSIINELADHSESLVLRWTQNEWGNLDNWLSVLKNVMVLVEDSHSELSGIEKAECATNAVVELAVRLWEKHTASLNEEEKQQMQDGDMKTVALIMNHPEILRASAGILKKVLNVIDTNNDGEISGEECKHFLEKYFCCICRLFKK